MTIVFFISLLLFSNFIKIMLTLQWLTIRLFVFGLFHSTIFFFCRKKETVSKRKEEIGRQKLKRHLDFTERTNSRGGSADKWHSNGHHEIPSDGLRRQGPVVKVVSCQTEGPGFNPSSIQVFFTAYIRNWENLEYKIDKRCKMGRAKQWWGRKKVGGAVAE